MSLGHRISLLYVTTTLLRESSTRNHFSWSSLTKSEPKIMSTTPSFSIFQKYFNKYLVKQRKGKEKILKMKKKSQFLKTNNKENKKNRNIIS